MNLQFALDNLVDGRYVARTDWGMRVYLYKEGDLVMYSHNGYDTPWQPGHPDLFAADWREVIPEP